MINWLSIAWAAVILWHGGNFNIQEARSSPSASTSFRPPLNGASHCLGGTASMSARWQAHLGNLLQHGQDDSLMGPTNFSMYPNGGFRTSVIKRAPRRSSNSMMPQLHTSMLVSYDREPRKISGAL